ncbi:hypothetical protein SAMN05216344_1332 [Polaromonas sp. OV174]|nr:hypothetical protein SAMN05216344_1332 [Polaromonas sp. OV174]
MPRDDFSRTTKDALAKRVGLRCSNPSCKASTSGPHSEASKSINLGVAAHITAAAPGGPRYDPNSTSEERASIDNEIWLSQNCAKLIDTDPAAYSSATLSRWKAAAEDEAMRAMGSPQYEYLPQPASAMHAPLPRIRDHDYDHARELLMQAGWQPYMNHWSKGAEWDMTIGNGEYFWNKCCHEIKAASPTGLAHCTFAFKDIRMQGLPSQAPAHKFWHS